MGKIAIYDEKIKIQRDNIDSARRALQQMDAAVDQTMSRSTSETGADKATAIRRSQARERTNLQNEIARAQTEIVKLNDQRAPIAAEVRKVEAEVGPIKYIAKLIYGDNPDANLLEHAVVWVIIMIVAVFDPLALVLILAAQQSIRWAKGEDLEEPVATTDAKTTVFGQFTEKIRRRFIKDDAPDFEGVKLPDGTWVQTGPAFNTAEPQEEYTSIDEVNRQLAEAREEPDYTEGSLVVQDTPIDEDYKPFKGTGVSPTGLVSTPYIQPQVEDEPEPDPFMEDLVVAKEEPELVPDPVAVDTPNPRAAEASPGQGRGAMYSAPIQADNSPQLGKAASTGFGNDFPANPQKGDVYLRTDYLPNRLYKFNDKKWIEVDKSSTDVYAYEEAYIRHLIEEIETNRYDADTLTDVEREQIAEYLRKNA
jgi:hypothetical protein